MSRKGPYCECANCDATGRETGREVVLPTAAWSVAGEAGCETGQIAVAPGHHRLFEQQGERVVDKGGWYVVGP